MLNATTMRNRFLGIRWVHFRTEPIFQGRSLSWRGGGRRDCFYQITVYKR